MRTASLTKLVEFVVVYCNIHGFQITPLKLQKILYYIQAWHIVKYDKHPLFNELPQAWVNGPVYRSVYDIYKDRFFRSTTITHKLVNEQGEGLLESIKNDLALEDTQIESINTILKHYSSIDEGKLVLLTHNDSPWNEARQGLGEFDRSENIISIDSMYNFYSQKAKK